MAVENLITDHLDIWTAAIKTKSSAGRGSSKKLELVGIKKLRELILELAVRGKLVPQDPSDEPASELLKKIEAEKVRLVKEGKIKKQKLLPPISDDKKSFELPKGWAWAYLQGLSTYIQRGKGPSYADMGSVKVISQKCIQNNGFVPSVARYINDESIENYQPERFIEDDDILWNSTGTGTVGRANVVAGIKPNTMVADSHVTVIRPAKVYSRFIWCFLMAPGIQKRIAPDHEHSLVSGSTKQVELNTSSVLSVVTPLAPIKEQHRIVAKVDELMALCDQLEAQTESSIDAHKTLVEVLLATLTDAKDADELNDNWQTISQHFDVLFTTQASIDQLKQTILQLAVMGKLVKQDPKDEPASKLLERIATEKQQLIKDKKIKKQTLLPAITDEKKPFEIPTGWSYTRLDDLCANVFSGSTPPKSELNETSGIPFLKVYNIQNQELEFEKRTLFVSANSHTGKLKRSILYPGDVVLNLVGPPLGKVAIMPNTYPEWNCNQNIICFRPLEIKLNRYIYTYLKAHIFLDYIDLVGSAGQDFISGAKCRAIVLPTPPLAEQQRIVAKVEELMTLCDSLKTRLNQAQTIQLHLTDAIVEQAL
jgi:type I restriction enzyme S subunit